MSKIQKNIDLVGVGGLPFAQFALKYYRLAASTKRSLEIQKSILMDALILIGQVAFAANNRRIERVDADGKGWCHAFP